MEAQSKARLVESPPSAERGVTATVRRSEIENTLKSAEGPALLVLDIARRGGDTDGADVQAHTLEVELERPDLEEILRTTSGDAIELRFDRAELEQALEEGDVDAHGLREKMVVLSIAAATAAGVAGGAAAMPMADGGGAAAVTAPAASHAVAGGPEWPRAAAAGQEESSPEASALAGGPEWPRAAAVGQEESSPEASALAGGPEWPRQAIADATDSLTAHVEPAGGGGGIDISSSEAVGAGLGGLALLITGASFAAGRRPRRPAQA
jgi:hypothetical protein